MKDNKQLAVTTAIFIALLFLGSAASEPYRLKPCKPAVKGSSKAPKQNRAVKSLQKRLDRFMESKSKLDEKIAEKRSEIRKSTGSKRDLHKKQLKRLQTRKDRIEKRIDKINADIKRIEKKQK